jgi:hypothetical protein
VNVAIGALTMLGAGLTVSDAAPQTEPAHALIVADPFAASTRAVPRLLTSSVMVAIELSDELQITDPKV